MKVKEGKEVIACDVSPVAMFLIGKRFSPIHPSPVNIAISVPTAQNWTRPDLLGTFRHF